MSEEDIVVIESLENLAEDLDLLEDEEMLEVAEAIAQAREINTDDEVATEDDEPGSLEEFIVSDSELLSDGTFVPSQMSESDESLVEDESE